MAKSLVSICLPTRNRAASLRATLENLRAQDYAPLEILISDNASDDATEQVCRECAAQDDRIRYVRQRRNIGLHGNHNFCLDAGHGEYLCICHDHDRRDPGIVSEYVAFLNEHPRVGVVCADWELFDDAGERIGVRDYRVRPVTPGLEYIDQTIRSGQSAVAIAGAMIRRAALGDIRFVLDAPIGFGDFPIWLQMAERWDVGHISRRLWSWRQNWESLSARPIEAVARDFEHNIGQYCDEHLQRWPAHADRVREWRANMRRYLFWALAYEVGLHFRDASSGREAEATRSLFEIMNYRLTPEQFQSALTQLRKYRSGVLPYAADAAIRALIQLRLTRPLAWVTRHQSSVRTLLGLR